MNNAQTTVKEVIEETLIEYLSNCIDADTLLEGTGINPEDVKDVLASAQTEYENDICQLDDTAETEMILDEMINRYAEELSQYAK